MSIERPVDLECPGCGHEQSVTVWESLNADVSPEAREELFEGKINLFVCESCSHRAMISVPLMYHDMTRRFVVQFFPFEATEEDDFLQRFDSDGTDRTIEKALEFGLPSGLNVDMEYMRQTHVVFDMAELVRWVLFRERVFDLHKGPESAES